MRRRKRWVLRDLGEALEFAGVLEEEIAEAGFAEDAIELAEGEEGNEGQEDDD